MLNIRDLKLKYILKDIICFPTQHEKFENKNRYYLLKNNKIIRSVRSWYGFKTDTINNSTIAQCNYKHNSIFINEKYMCYIDSLLTNDFNKGSHRDVIIKYKSNNNIFYGTGRLTSFDWYNKRVVILSNKEYVDIDNILLIEYYNKIYKFLRETINEK